MKHQIAKLKSGGYNYRGYCIYLRKRGVWFVRDFDEEKDVWRTPTLRAMKRKIDAYERDQRRVAARIRRGHALGLRRHASRYERELAAASVPDCMD